MKREHSKNISALLGLIFSINLAQVVSASSFNDISGHWAENAISRISEFEIINGFGGSFRPNSPITRGELAVILDRLMVYQNKSPNKYIDLDNNFYTDSILKLTKADIMNGSNNTVRPKDNVSREEAATMIARAFNINLSEGEIVPFSDTSEISDWALEKVNALLQNEIITGNGTAFKPKDNITRAEVVTILNNILGGYYKKPGTFSENTNKSVIVAGSDVKLKNTVIEKDLIISAGVGEGDVTLSNVTVKGRTLVYGGGSHSIHIEENSSLGTVELEKDGEPIRIVSDNTSSVGTVLLKENNADTIIEGKIENVQSLSSDKQIEVRGEINKLSLKGNNTTLNLSQNGKIDKVSIGQNVSNNNIVMEKGASINTINTSSNINIDGEGRISNINQLSNNISVSVLDSIKIDSTSSQISNSSGSSNSNNSSSNQTQKPKIVSVESVKNGLVRFTLDKKFDGTLTKDMISILCTTGGSDMTVLNVKTSDNIVFDVTTAYYKDNTYSLGITFPDRTLIEKEFEVRSLAPTISSMKVNRESANAANILYISDTPGKFYYILKENNNARVRRNAEITEEYVVKNGTTISMKAGGNTINISNLKKDKAYTMYYVAEDLGGNRTVLKQTSITAKFETDVPAINILNAEGFFKNNGFFGENYWFEFEISQTTPLKLEDISIICPADGKLTLGRLETTNNKIYKVYMKRGYVPSSDNTYTLNIKFADGSVAKKDFFVDFNAPSITKTAIKRLSENSAEVTFNSNEAGSLYYKVLPKTEVPQDTSPKDPNKIIKDGTKVKLYEGGNTITLDNIATKDVMFCFVSEDAKGNIMAYYDYEKIPNNVQAPEKPNPENGIKFEILEVGKEDYMGRESTYLKVKFEDVNFYLSNQYVTITNKQTGQSFTGYRYFDIESGSDVDYQKIYYKGKVLENGEYTLKINDGSGKIGSLDFTVK